MTTSKQDLFLIAGIPGTGKTTFGETLSKQFGFAHYDLEEPGTVNRCATNPARFIDEIMQDGSRVAVTWGFVPDHAYSVQTVLQFRQSGFKLVWLDGNRPAALRVFQARAKSRAKSEADYDRQMNEFYVQMNRIETTEVVETMKPVIINPFNDNEQFKSVAELLTEIRRA